MGNHVRFFFARFSAAAGVVGYDALCLNPMELCFFRNPAAASRLAFCTSRGNDVIFDMRRISTDVRF